MLRTRLKPAEWFGWVKRVFRINTGINTVYISWLVSYISILLIPVIISGVVYLMSINIVSSEFTRANTALLTQVQQAIDTRLRNIERLSLEIFWNPKVQGNIFLQSLLLEKTSRSLATLAIFLDERRLKEIITTNKWVSQGKMYIINPDNRILTSIPAHDLPPAFPFNKLVKSQGFFTSRLNGEKVVISYISSQMSNWKYVLLIPARIYMEKVVYIRRLTLISFILCLLIGGIIAYYFSKRNYLPLIFYRNPPYKPQDKYFYPLATEQQLITFIKTGNYLKAGKILDEIFEKNFTRESISIQMAQCLMFDLAGTIIKIINEIDKAGEVQFIEDLNPVKRLFECKTISELQERIIEIIKQICDYFETKKKSHNYQLKGKILAYIEDHYRDSNLNIKAMAGEFNISPGYLSRFFKEQTGEGLLDYINKTRLKRARVLLKEQKLNIGEIAAEVGFYNSDAFIRIFKKYFEITPGKYKGMKE